MIKYKLAVLDKQPVKHTRDLKVKIRDDIFDEVKMRIDEYIKVMEQGT